MKKSSTQLWGLDAVPEIGTTYLPVFLCGYLYLFDVYARVCGVVCEIHRTYVFCPKLYKDEGSFLRQNASFSNILNTGN